MATFLAVQNLAMAAVKTGVTASDVLTLAALWQEFLACGRTHHQVLQG